MRDVLLALVFLCLAGCAKSNLRSCMERAAAPSKGVKQTQFAHIGELHIDDRVYHVATQRLVLEVMLAPRGLRHRLLIFDNDARLVSTYEYNFDSAEPLWCHGSRVYLFGNGSFMGIEPGPRLVLMASEDEQPIGNVIDFSNGPTSPILTREKQYGSSGGIEDDPWR